MIEDRFLRALRAVVNAFTEKTRCHVPVRYRVVAASGPDRYDLQAVQKSAGWPDLVPCAVSPGAAGYKANLAIGSTVLVQFVEGDVALPLITHFEVPGAPGFVPIGIKIGADAGAAPAAARVGDIVTIFFPSPMAFAGTVGGAPATGTVTIPGPGVGTIQTGSTKVGIGG